MTQERRAAVLLVVLGFVYVAFIAWCVGDRREVGRPKPEPAAGVWHAGRQKP